MPDWKPEIRARLGSLNLEAAREAEIVEELSQHLDDRFAELRGMGATEDEAKRLVLEELSKAGFLAGELRRIERTPRPVSAGADEAKGGFMNGFLGDLKFGARMLGKNPGFMAVVAVTLALGIGANTAIFSVVNAVLLRPLGYPNPDRLVAVWERDPGRGGDRARVSGPDFIDWRDQSRVFEHIGFWNSPSEINLVTTDGVEKVKGSYVYSSLFPALGVNPALGRAFLPEEDQRENNRVAVISFGLWKRHFGGDLNILGRTLTVDTYGRGDYQIVGVMPEGFRFPEQCDLCLAYGWMGVRLDERRSAHWYQVFGRLSPGVSMDQATAEMNAIQAGIKARNPGDLVGTQVEVIPLLEQTVGRELRSVLLILCGVVASVLLIACANVANLLLARAIARRREIAVRLALGASRWRVTRQLLAESLLLAGLGGSLGVVSAFWGLRLLAVFGGDRVPRLLEARLDLVSLAFTFLISLVAGIVFGLAPVWQFVRPGLGQSLNDGTRNSGGPPSRNRLRSILVVSEMGLALVLLVGAGLMAKSFIRLVSINRGFQPEHLVAADLDFSASGFTTWVEPTATRPQVVLRDIVDRLRSGPDTPAVGVISALSRESGGVPGQVIVIENRPAVSLAEAPAADFHGVTPGLFRAMGVPFLSGRDFTESDTLESPRVAIVNQTLARRYFPSENPVGKRLALGGRRNPAELRGQIPWIEIVGVVADMKKLSPAAETVPEIFAPYWQWPMQRPTLLARTAGDAGKISAAIHDAVKAANKNLPAPAIRTMDAILAETVAQPRFHTMLVGLFGIVALALAAVGIYGVMACLVAQRTREIGLRLALGATKWNVLSMVIGQGLKLAVVGVLLGLAASLALTRVMASLLYQVEPTDPWTFGGAAVLLILVAVFACLWPARRATRVDPMVTLRYE